MDTLTHKPNQPQKVTAERIKRFERLGGVDLSRREWEDPIHALVHTGTVEFKQAFFQFECPECLHRVRSNQEMEPMCTGPMWTDDHAPEIMRLVK